MTGTPDAIERNIADLEGATQALNNFAQSAELTVETKDGLHWLALQIDGYMADLRENWDALHTARRRQVMPQTPRLVCAGQLSNNIHRCTLHRTKHGGAPPCFDSRVALAAYSLLARNCSAGGRLLLC